MKLQKHNTEANDIKYKNGLHCTTRILKTEGVCLLTPCETFIQCIIFIVIFELACYVAKASLYFLLLISVCVYDGHRVISTSEVCPPN